MFYMLSLNKKAKETFALAHQQAAFESMRYAERYLHLVINSGWTPILVGEVINLSWHQVRKQEHGILELRNKVNIGNARTLRRIARQGQFYKIDVLPCRHTGKIC